MLEATYLHAPGIGRVTERSLWDAGVLSWRAFLDSESLPITHARRETAAPMLEHSIEALKANDHTFFARNLPASEQWRAAGEFADRMGFLDIETTGMGQEAHPTVAGIFDFASGEMRTWIYGENLRDFVDAVDDYRVLVTFFGTGFDLPVLQNWDPRIKWHQIHVDLCPMFRRLGYKGGLKVIERRLGLARPGDLDGMSGWDAVMLWRQYRQGNESALETLLRYNREDCVNLARLLPIAVRGLQQAAGYPG